MTWNDIHGWFNYQAFYEKVISECPEQCWIAEVGCWQGRSICFLASLAKRLKPNVRFYAIDSWHAQPDQNHVGRTKAWHYHNFVNNIVACGVSERIHTIPGDSAKSASYFDNGSLWMAFIDASHFYADVKRDIYAWKPKVMKGGWLAGHDWDESWPEVKKAVLEYGTPDVFGPVWRFVQ